MASQTPEGSGHSTHRHERRCEEYRDSGQVEAGNVRGAQVRERPVVRHRIRVGGTRLPDLVPGTGQGTRIPGCHQHRQQVRPGVDHTGLVSELLCEGGRIAVHQPRLPHEVVHAEDPSGRQVPAVRRNGLLREQVALQPDRPLAEHDGEGVGQGQEYEVPPPVRPLQEGPAVIYVHVHAGIVVGPVRVAVTGKGQDRRVDLHGVDAGRSPLQGDGHVVA